MVSTDIRIPILGFFSVSHIPLPAIGVFASPHVNGGQPFWPGTLWRYTYGRAHASEGDQKRDVSQVPAHIWDTVERNAENPPNNGRIHQ